MDFDHDVYLRNRETKTGYYLIKEGTRGLSPPMAERLTGFGAELVHRHGTNESTVHVPMSGAQGVKVMLEVYGMHMERAGNKF